MPFPMLIGSEMLMIVPLQVPILSLLVPMLSHVVQKVEILQSHVASIYTSVSLVSLTTVPLYFL